MGLCCSSVNDTVIIASEQPYIYPFDDIWCEPDWQINVERELSTTYVYEE